MSDRFYITTPIYYPNGEPHLGSVYCTLAADTIARFERLTGRRTHFLTGTDEHGIKMVKSAAEQGTTAADLAAKNTGIFKQVFNELGFTHDDFIHTSESRHKDRVARLCERMIASGDIYLGSYEGWYDEGQEEFVTESEAKDREYKSAISGRPLTRYKEQTYFFKLTKYSERVYRAIESDQLLVRPVNRKNEVLSKLKGWSQDLSISRASLTWGIPLPNDPTHVLYVWIDALTNYITALGIESDDETLFDAFWPVDLHLIGKEILWFHAFYWPAMLMSLDLELPKKIFAHGWFTAEGKKMSKSLGNFIDMDRIRGWSAKYSFDTIRYYCLRIAPFGSDMDFVEADLLKSYADLGNVLGNLLNRSMNMIGKYRDGVVPAVGTSGPEDAALIDAIEQMPARLRKAYDEVALQDAVLIPLEVARAANTYIDQTRPFTIAKDPAQAERLNTVLNLIARATASALAGLVPALPEKARAGLAQMNVDTAGKSFDQLLASVAAGHRLGTASVLFPKVDEPKPA
jgi:methionyl-tRNA synthetase